MQIEHTLAFLDALAGRDTVYDWRAIHDTNKGAHGQSLRGTFAQVAAQLDAYQAQGYGVFIVVNESNGNGVLASDIVKVRANFIDYDGVDPTWQAYQAVAQWSLPPTLYVVGAVPGKFHAYWKVTPYELSHFEGLQRKLIAKWQSDPPVTDLPRVMRLPGSLHLKDPANPVIVQCIAGSGATYSEGQLDWALADVAAGIGGAETVNLGEASLAAPNFEWAVYALNKVDPNSLAREDWIKLTAAFKQAAWSHGTPEAIEAEWRKWCARYATNDVAENAKNWRSIRGTKTGWGYLGRVSGAIAELKFGGQSVAPVASVAGVAEPAKLDNSTPFLMPVEQADYFKGCVYIERMGRILTPSRRYMDASKFNASYGGKVFVLDAVGKGTTDEPWRAATRGQVFRVPRVDHTRFLPTVAPGALVSDDLGRLGVNTYKPAAIKMSEGDVAPFINHLRAIIPTEHDVRVLVNYFAHVVQRPGVKAFWAPVIQSSEGAGKGIILEALTYAVGSIYVHAPNAKELVDAGSKFNSWMLDKILIIANEIRVDDKRDMLDALKPMITELRMEFQSKGVDQEMNDNVANWIMFTNFKDAIPIKRDDRRYAIFYSTIQSVDDLAARGMTGAYFPKLYAWLKAEGREYIAHWLQHWQIEPEFDPAGNAHRAPETSSKAEALLQSLGRVEQAINEAVEEGATGFRGGWLSSVAVARLMNENGIKTTTNALNTAFKTLGYHKIGRSGATFAQEGYKQPWLHNLNPNASMRDYGSAQGYI